MVTRMGLKMVFFDIFENTYFPYFIPFLLFLTSLNFFKIFSNLRKVCLKCV